MSDFDYPPSVRRLIAAFRQLPSVGARSAERLALHVLRSHDDLSVGLEESLANARDRVKACKHCGFYTEEEICSICSNPKRNSKLVCVVQEATDVVSFEKSGVFEGVYYVLGGLLSPLDGIGPNELGVPALLSKLEEREAEEVILGLPSDVKGDTTNLYLAREIKAMGLKVTRLATGISAGGSLEFVDSVTLGHALEGRKGL